MSQPFYHCKDPYSLYCYTHNYTFYCCCAFIDIRAYTGMKEVSDTYSLIKESTTSFSIYHSSVEMASIKCEKLSDEETSRISRVFGPVVQKGQSFVRALPGNVIVNAAFEKFKDRYKQWPVRQDDVYVLTFPKNGSTWTQELVWLIQNDCNFEEAKAVPLYYRFPFIDTPVILDFMKDEMPALQGDALGKMEDIPSPRLLKSHFNLCLLPDSLIERSKAVFCLRNPKDTIVSYYHHEKMMTGHGYIGDFATYFDLFMDDLILYCPYFEYVKEVWQRRNHPNVCVLIFEDMKQDLATSVRMVAKFLGKDVTDEKVQSLIDHLCFENMKSNKSVNYKEFTSKEDEHFMRKGEVGDWKNYFTDEMNRRMDEAIEKHLKPIGLEFRYE